MDTPAEFILLVESDPDISNFIARQTLQPLGYRVKVSGDASSAIQQAAQLTPDLIITNLNLPGLSGKDLLVAMQAQEIQIPLIIIAEKGQENNVIQAFRLGASDTLFWPAREAEVVAVVERVLKQVRERNARQKVDRQLKEANQELSRRARELTTIFAIGKAVISIADQRVLFNKLVTGMVSVTEADYGWLLLRDDHARTFVLAAHHNLPEAWAKKTGQPLDDGVSSLVVLSGETLAINGEPINRFKMASLGQSAVVVPVKIQQEVIGLLVVIRKANLPFDRPAQALLEAIGDHASISLVNARLFRALQEKADSTQAGEKYRREQLQGLRIEILNLLQPVNDPVDRLLAGSLGELTDEQKQALTRAQYALQQVLKLITQDRPPQPGNPLPNR